MFLDISLRPEIFSPHHFQIKGIPVWYGHMMSQLLAPAKCLYFLSRFFCPPSSEMSGRIWGELTTYLNVFLTPQEQLFNSKIPNTVDNKSLNVCERAAWKQKRRRTRKIMHMRGTGQSASEYSLLLKKLPTVKKNSDPP